MRRPLKKTACAVNLRGQGKARERMQEVPGSNSGSPTTYPFFYNAFSGLTGSLCKHLQTAGELQLSRRRTYRTWPCPAIVRPEPGAGWHHRFQESEPDQSTHRSRHSSPVIVVHRPSKLAQIADFRRPRGRIQGAQNGPLHRAEAGLSGHPSHCMWCANVAV
jgi:hypothetical protein